MTEEWPTTFIVKIAVGLHPQQIKWQSSHIVQSSITNEGYVYNIGLFQSAPTPNIFPHLPNKYEIEGPIAAGIITLLPQQARRTR